jgi:hypothetical protein
MPRLSMRTLAIAATAMAFAVEVRTTAQEVGKAGRANKLQATSSVTQLNAPAIPPFGLIGYLASPGGRVFRKGSNHPLLRALAQRLGEPVDDQAAAAPSVPAPPATSAVARPDALAAGCGGAMGTRFNLEPRAAPAVAPQNGPAVDFLPGAGLSGGDLVVGSANDTRGLFGGLGDSSTGYYVHRNGASPNGCFPDFDGGLPSFPSRVTGEVIFGGGDSALEADPARAAIFVVDTRMASTVSTLGLFRNSAAALNNTATCPNGTHDGPAAATCWPVHAEINPRADGSLNIQPQLAVDSRPTGAGAGDVYVTNTFETLSGIHIVLTACSNSLAACSPAVLISGGDGTPQTPYVRVRPGGGVTVTYVNVQNGPAPNFLQAYDIKYVACTPQGAPNPPSCSAPKLIIREDQPIPSKGGGLGGGSLAAANFVITTFPKHDHRQDTNGTETYVIWDRCKVPNIQGGDLCPDVDIRLAASNNNGASWAFGNVDTGKGDQYFPAIRTDSSNIVNIAYMSAEGDGGMNHRAQVLLRQIAPGGTTPDPVSAATVITTMAMDPSADFFFGDAFIGSYIGVAGRSTASGRHTYIHFTHTAVNGIYNGVPAPEQNNHLSRFDY